MNAAHVLGVFDEVESPVIATRDVVTHVECSQERAQQQLTALYEQNEIDRRTIGPVTVWWRCDDRVDLDAELRRLSEYLQQGIVVGKTAYKNGEHYALNGYEVGEGDDVEAEALAELDRVAHQAGRHVDRPLAECPLCSEGEH
jgi:hypothetical protein